MIHVIICFCFFLNNYMQRVEMRTREMEKREMILAKALVCGFSIRFHKHLWYLVGMKQYKMLVLIIHHITLKYTIPVQTFPSSELLFSEKCSPCKRAFAKVLLDLYHIGHTRIFLHLFWIM